MFKLNVELLGDKAEALQRLNLNVGQPENENDRLASCYIEWKKILPNELMTQK